MPKPWEYDWSGGGDPSGPNLLPIVPFFGRQRPPMLGGDGRATLPPALVAGPDSLPSFDPSVMEVDRLFTPTATYPASMASSGPTSGPAIDPSSGPATAALPSPQQLPAAAPPMGGRMPAATGADGGRLQPAAFSNWGAPAAEAQTATSSGQADPDPARLMLAQQRSTLDRVPDMIPPMMLMRGNSAGQQKEPRKPVPGLILPPSSDRPGMVNRPLWFSRIEHEGETSKQNSVSPKGAITVMQIMPGTARDAARMLKVRLNWNLLRTDPDYARSLGHAYLDFLLRKYQGDVVLATAAYNGGLGNVDRWIRTYGDPRHGDISHTEFIQHVPYKETRDYVGRVVFGETRAEQDLRKEKREKEKLARAQRQQRMQSRGVPPPLIEKRHNTPG